MAALQKDVVIIGGGPAGLAAAIRLHDRGIADIVILEREKQLGGILRQCIHDGFGLSRFRQALSGPEYSQRFIDEVNELGIQYVTDAMVLDITPEKKVTAVSKKGLIEYQAKAVVLAMGCRERTRGAVSIPGTRPAGIYNAGVAQSYINLHNTMVGKEVVILGSGDIGMIMARRMTLEGAQVRAVFEVQPYPSGLPRNIEQCLNDYDIPLYLSHTVTDIKGDSRLTGVTVSQVDECLQPIPGTEKEYSCDTLVLSVGLIPENELSLKCGVELDERTKGAAVDENYQTTVKGVFAAGNVLQVHDLVDFVSLEAEAMADSAAEYLLSGALPDCGIAISTDANVSHVVPQKISGEKDFKISLRVRKPFNNCTIEILQQNAVIKTLSLKKVIPAEMIQIHVGKTELKSTQALKVVVRSESPACSEPLAAEETWAALATRKSRRMVKEYTCIICPNGCEIEAEIEESRIIALEGATCERGRKYVEQELADPQRNIATLALIDKGDVPLASVRLNCAIPKARIFEVMAEMKKVKLTAPVVMGQIVLKNVLGLGSDVISTINVRRRCNESN